MKIAVLCTAFPPEHSGAGVRIRRMLLRLRDRGVDATVLTPRRPGLPARTTEEGIEVLRLGEAREDSLRSGLDFGARAAAWLLAHARQTDLLYAQSMAVGHGPVALAARLGRVPALMEMTLRGWDDPAAFGGDLSGRARAVLYRLFPHHIALYPGQAEDQRRRWPEIEPAHVVPSGIDTASLRPATAEEKRTARASLDLPAEATVLCAVGGAMHRKGLDRAVGMFCRIAPSRPDLHFLWAGPDRFPAGSHYARFLEEMRGRLEGAGLSARFHLLGRRDDVATIYGASDLFVFPSRREGLPSVLLEAMACGLPCLVSPLEGASSFALRGAGRTVRGEEEVWAREVEDVLDDAPLRSFMGRAARNRAVEAFDLDRVTDLLHQTLRNVAGAAA